MTAKSVRNGGGGVGGSGGGGGGCFAGSAGSTATTISLSPLQALRAPRLRPPRLRQCRHHPPGHPRGLARRPQERAVARPERVSQRARQWGSPVLVHLT